ncbi:MAG: hypothetical protein KAQ99_06220, partial [Candidatus Aureabacteria bacterium]|nr:hypothetical protein [Candidatus Auribacterota bacterium]
MLYRKLRVILFVCVSFFVSITAFCNEQKDIFLLNDTKYIKEVLNQFEEKKESLDNQKLLRLLKKGTKKEIFAEVEPFENILGGFKKGIKAGESAKSNVNMIDYHTPLNFIIDLKLLCNLLFLEAKYFFLEEREMEAIQNIFLARKGAYLFLDDSLFIICMSRFEIKSISSALLYQMVKKTDKIEVIEKILLNSIKKDVKSYEEMFIVEEQKLLDFFEKHVIQHLTQKAQENKNTFLRKWLFFLKDIILNKEKSEQVSITTLNDIGKSKIKESFENVTYLEIKGSFKNKVIEIETLMDSLKYDESKMVHSLVNNNMDAFCSEVVNKLLEIIFPGATRTIYSIMTDEVIDDLLTISIMLKTYQIKKGEYPDSLDELKDIGILNIPLDKFSEEDFKYKKSSDEKDFDVWSIGPDLVDDNMENFFNLDTKKGDVFIR